MNKKTKTKIKRYVGLLLSAALLITGLLAFLTATDSKTNTFTIGDVKITLWEEFDVDNDGNITDGTGGNPDNIFGKNEEPPVVQNILPGDEIIKAPYIENTGTNDAWVYMIVSVPTADISEFENLHSTNAETLQKTIDIKAYAIQDKYDGETNDTASEVWAAYVGTDSGTGNVDYTDLLGNAVTPDSGRTEIFEIIGLDVYNEETNPNGEWDTIDTYYGADGNNYYIYARREMLPAEDNATASPAVSDETSKLFTAVRLSPLVGEHQAAPFMPVEPDDFFWKSAYEPYFLTPVRHIEDSAPDALDETWGIDEYQGDNEGFDITYGNDLASTNVVYYMYNGDSGTDIDSYAYASVVGGDINSDGCVTVEDRDILSQMLSLSDPGTGDWGISEEENVIDAYPDDTGDELIRYNYHKYIRQLAADIDGIDGLSQGDIEAFNGVIAGTHKIVYRSEVNSSGGNVYEGVRRNGKFTVVAIPDVPTADTTSVGFCVLEDTECSEERLTDLYSAIIQGEGTIIPDNATSVVPTRSSNICKTGDEIKFYDENNVLLATQYIVVPGDVTCDGAVDKSDYIMMKNMLNKPVNKRDWGWMDSGLPDEVIARNIRMSSMAANMVYDYFNAEANYVYDVNDFDEYDAMALYLYLMEDIYLVPDSNTTIPDTLNLIPWFSWSRNENGHSTADPITPDTLVTHMSAKYPNYK